MKYLILLLIIAFLGYVVYQFINKLINKINNARIEKYKKKLYKSEIKNEYYKKLNKNKENNWRPNFGIEEEKNWKKYWNNYKPPKEKNSFIKVIIFLIKIIFKILKFIIYAFILLLLISIFQTLNKS